MTLSEHLDLIVARLQSFKDDPRYADIMPVPYGITDADQLEDLHGLAVDISYVLDDLFRSFAGAAGVDGFNHEVSDRIVKNLGWAIIRAAELACDEGTTDA